eukprot:759315-Hanusia_phi.AAC.1
MSRLSFQITLSDDPEDIREAIQVHLEAARDALLPPRRCTSESDTLLLLDRDQRGSSSFRGLPLQELPSRFLPSSLDTVTVAVCAGGGKPFLLPNMSALQVLQMINKAALMSADATAVDVFFRGGNLLGSFGTAVVKVASCSKL